MTTHIKVYPAKASALNVFHPSGARPRAEGEMWPNDVFTMRRLTDGSFTHDPAKAYKEAATSIERQPVTAKPAEPAKPADPPAAAKAPPAKND